MPDDPLTASEAYLDALFGPGAGRRHSRFLEHVEHPGLREALHRCHRTEADTRVLSVEENYLIGMCVLYALHCFGPAGMFARTLLHLGVDRAKLLEAVARLEMWTGPVPAAVAAGHLQRAADDWARRGTASLDAWFPPPDRPESRTGDDAPRKDCHD
ncbi:hypothetical protein [Streptomyces sp. NPDC060184]|uniref:hypothetical protein n=1 Tax=Streptomyces sp. NPDC060184 TaxID=3347064 RepID=UPI0036547F3C